MNKQDLAKQLVVIAEGLLKDPIEKQSARFQWEPIELKAGAAYERLALQLLHKHVNEVVKSALDDAKLAKSPIWSYRHETDKRPDVIYKKINDQIILNLSYMIHQAIKNIDWR